MFYSGNKNMAFSTQNQSNCNTHTRVYVK